MSSFDVRDMLDLPSSAGPRPAKKQKTLGPRPNLKGLQREVQSLGGDNPISIVPIVPAFKKRRFLSKKPATKWTMEPFRNSARQDGLILKHWRRVEDVPVPSEDAEEKESKHPEIKDSQFAKFNVQVNVPTYTEEQYESTLQDPDWTKDETDYLMSVVKDFDLRWPVIWDRYEYEAAAQKEEPTEDNSQALIPEPKVRSMEDLKARYYKVASKMMAINRRIEHMSQAEFNLHALMDSFKPEQERKRKQYAELSMQRSIEERREEENLMIELKRIMARNERFNADRDELYATLDSPHSTISGSMLSQYTTSQGLTTLVQTLASVDKSRKRKSLLGPEGNNSPAPAGPTSTPTTLQQRESVDRRDSIREPLPSASGKKTSTSTPTERRVLTKEEEIMYGVSHHERLNGGPHFRHEKVTKQLTAKSTIQTQKISNILSELNVPVRLRMPTSEVVAAFESLLGSVNSLLDARKVVDKYDAEIKILETLKKERETKARRERGEPTPEAEKAEAAAAAAAEAEATNGDDGNKSTKIEEGDTDMDGLENSSAAVEDDGETRQNGVNGAPSTRASSAAHKRSASEMSQ